MIRNILAILCLLTLAACATTPGSNKEFRPRAPASEAVSANINLAFEYMRRGEYEAALEKMERARLADPDYFGTYNAFGLLYQQLGQNKQAERNYKKALSLNGSDSATMNNYGQFLCQTGKIKDAEKIFLRAAENPLYNTPEVAITNAGTCLLLNNDNDGAEKHFRRALEFNSNIPVALFYMSQLSYDRQNYMSARGYLQRFAGISPHTAGSLLLGVRIENQLGDNDAVSSYALMLRNNFPESAETKELRSMGIR